MGTPTDPQIVRTPRTGDCPQKCARAKGRIAVAQAAEIAAEEYAEAHVADVLLHKGTANMSQWLWSVIAAAYEDGFKAAVEVE